MTPEFLFFSSQFHSTTSITSFQFIWHFVWSLTRGLGSRKYGFESRTNPKFYACKGREKPKVSPFWFFQHYATFDFFKPEHRDRFGSKETPSGFSALCNLPKNFFTQFFTLLGHSLFFRHFWLKRLFYLKIPKNGEPF